MSRFLLLNNQVRLQRKWHELCDGLAGGFALSLGQLLVQKGVLTVQEKDQINPKWTTLQQNEKLLKFILYSDDETYERFLQVLEDHLPWMADELHEDVPEEELQRHQDAVKRTCTLPSKLSHFTDREEERRQITTWLTDSRNTRTVIVQGHGGLGKTAIAIQVGYELLQSYGVRVVRARLQNVKTTFDILYSVLSSFNDVTLDLAEIGSRNSILEGKLRNLLVDFRGNILLILDGCEAVVENEECSKGFWGIIAMLQEQCQNALILCTTQRDIRPPPSLPTKVLVLTALLERDAKVVINKLCPRLNDDQALQIAKACGCIPSILESACDLPINANMEPTKLVEILSVKLSQKFDACFELAYQSLSIEEKHCLQYLSIFPIGFTCNDAEPFLTDSGKTPSELLQFYQRRTFISFDGSNAEPFYTMHGILRSFIKNKLTDQEMGSIEKHFILHLQIKIQELNTLCESDELRKASELFSTQRENLMEAVAIFCKPSFQYKPLVAETVSTLAHVLYTLAIYRVSLQAYYALLSFKTEARAVKNEREVAHIRRMLGCIHYKLAEYKEATENVLKALEWYHQDQGSSINIPLCFHTLGLIHGESGNLPRALEMFQNTLQWCEAHGDEEIKMVCFFSIEMAKLLCAASDFDKADEEFTASVQQHLTLCDEKVERNQAGVGIDFNIGRARRMSRDCDTRGAVLEMRRGFRRILGDYPYTSLNLIVLVELLFLRPEHSDFHSLLDSACKVFQEVCDNEDTAIMFLFKALHAGKDEAMSYYNYALEILRQILGDHLLTVITLRNKAQFLQGIRMLDESCSAYRESLSMVSRFVCDHPLHATVLHELGLVMADLGLKDDGLWHCERALEMRQRILGEDHKSTIESKKAVRSLADTFEELDLCGDSEDE